MRRHRFYVAQNIGEAKEIAISDSELIHQLSSVFRFKAGDKVILFDGSGFEYEAEIVSLNKKEVALKILNKKEKNILQNNITLYLSVIKKGNFELAVEKCTEVGVSEIHPIISERSEKKDLNIERLNKIVKEASEQCGRVTLPKVFEIQNLAEAVLQAKKEGRAGVVFHTDTDASTAPNPSLSKEGKGKDVAVFIGPEGGFTEKEMELFRKNNFQIRSLGQNILRAETAAIVASSLFLIL